MRNYLLAGTSALALALTAGAANAQTAPGKFDIKITGDAYVEGGYVSQTLSQNAGGVDFENRFRLVVNPVATADNGITYGALARLRANANTGLIDGDKAYVYVAGNFGEIRGGVTYGPGDYSVNSVVTPMDASLLTLYDQWRSYTGGTGSTNAAHAPTGYVNSGTNTTLTGATTGYAWGQFNNGAIGSNGIGLLLSHNIDTKIVYFTPRFFGTTPTTGLQGAVSYAPRNGDTVSPSTSVNTDVNRSLYTAGGSASLQREYFDDAYEFNLNYSDTISGFLVKGSAGYAGGSAHNDASGGGVNAYHDLESYQVGGQLGYAGFVLGAGYVYGGKSGYTEASWVNATGTTKFAGYAPGEVSTRLKDQYAWNVGGEYTLGPWVFGVRYLEEVDAGNLAYSGSRSLGAVTGGTMYTVAPGLRVGAEYTHYDATSNVPAYLAVAPASTNNDSGDVVLVRTQVQW